MNNHSNYDPTYTAKEFAKRVEEQVYKENPHLRPNRQFYVWLLPLGLLITVVIIAIVFLVLMDPAAQSN